MAITTAKVSAGRPTGRTETHVEKLIANVKLDEKKEPPRVVVKLNQEERKAFKLWCLENDTEMSTVLRDFILSKIYPKP
jgi:hypothetical protein